MEEEQEQLNSSLLALTTHFAQVQFRLKQIVSAEPDDKEVRNHLTICSRVLTRSEILDGLEFCNGLEKVGKD